MPPIIRVENLGKKYTLRHQGAGGGRYRRFSEELLDALKRPLRSLLRAPRSLLPAPGSPLPAPGSRLPAPGSPLPASRPPLPAPCSPLPAPGSPLPAPCSGLPAPRSRLPAPCSEDFWALRNVSFEVQQGEVLGIIGRNGAGKSTLLKILSRITEPTEGRVTLNGRVASLLEVGTGFHPELTGRENVYLNGAILGMSRAEIRRKFDEIVAFAEVEKFLDTPVKRYSSGMYVRLAFAVAAHLEPEILIVDEVLAVGDTGFQRKCLGKMGEVASAGRTVLFVSHSLPAVQSLCTRCVLLEEGCLLADGDIDGVLGAYRDLLSESETLPLATRADRQGDGRAVLVDVRLQGPAGEPAFALPMGHDWTIGLTYACRSRIARPHLGFAVETMNGQRVTRELSSETLGDLPAFSGHVRITCHMKNINLVSGRYQLTFDLSEDGVVIDRIERAVNVEILPADVFGLGRVSDLSRSLCYYPCTWSVEVNGAESSSTS